MIRQRVAFKAPGKVLIAGGYGVLQEQNLGLTLAVNKYFYSVSSAKYGTTHNQGIKILVKSNQIKGTWSYCYYPQKRQIEEINKRSNLFVENALKYALAYCNSLNKILQIQSIDIDILFDRGFLSETNKISQQIKFIDYTNQSTKTGLGSSACVTVVVVGGLLKLILGHAEQNVVNCLSQVSNLAAQNKIGSNFDISTAVYGSHLYKNVLPRKAYEVVSSMDFINIMKIDSQVQVLQKMPPMLREGRCWLLDLKKGSNTRTMVSSFIKQLNLLKNDLVIDFYQKSKNFVKEIWNHLSSEQSQNIHQEILKIKSLNKQYRQFLQFYSKQTNIPVQPHQLSEFLDQICALKEVIYAICPGSGGYDAIFILSMAKEKGQTLSLQQKINRLSLKFGLESSLTDISIEYKKEQITEEELIQIDKYLH